MVAVQVAPDGQSLQDVCASVSWNVPLGQGLQASAPPLSTLSKYLPVEHATHPAPARKKPGLHSENVALLSGQKARSGHWIPAGLPVGQ